MALSRAATRPIASLLNPAIGRRRRYSSSRASGAPGGRPSHQVACFDPSRLPCVGGGLLSSRWFSGGASPTDNMSLIRQLRERTCAPIKDVKSALISCDWDLDAAQKELRKRGVVLASKKSAWTAAEGLLALAQSESKVAVIELNCETDFVARNDIFQYLALSLARTALSVEGQHGDMGFAFGPEHLEEVKIRFDHPKLTGETTGQSAITEVAAMVGENVKLRRGFTMSKSSHGVVSSYLHTCPQPGLGRIAGILTLESDDENVSLDALQKVGSSLAMHIVAAKPLFLSNELVSSEEIANEREILKTQPTRPEDEHDQEGKDQVEEVSSPISMPQGPITRSKSKKLQQALIHHLQGLVNSASEELQGHQSFGANAAQVQYNLIQVQVTTNGFN